jgi:hypothetical protein
MLGFLLGSFALFGQHGRGGGGGGAGFGSAGGGWRASGASGAGFGNILFPGGAPGHPSIAPLPAGFGNTSFGSALGATVRGVPPPGPVPGRAPGYGRGGYGGGRTVIVPYPVLAAPAYYPYGYGYGYDQPVMVQPDAGYMQQQQPPVVIINQNYKPDTIAPVVREYNNLPQPGGAAAEQQQPQQQESTLKVYENRTGPRAALEEEKPTIFLIAMKEGNIMPALAFWVEGDTLHYITRESSHNKISLDRIDREFSVRLNKERGLEFRIP